jgi:glycosyltransferase involved in cell wall biosynthesis
LCPVAITRALAIAHRISAARRSHDLRSPVPLTDPSTRWNLARPGYAPGVNLLFIASKIHGQNRFILDWAKAFAAQCYKVKLVLQEAPQEPVSGWLDDRPPGAALEIYSLGKEKGHGKPRQALRFSRLVASLPYDCVFIYGTPIWGALGSWYWIPRRVPTYLWYTHYTMHPSLRVTCWFAKRLFCATEQSLPQYDGSPKKVVTGHGIDLSYWPERPNEGNNPHRLLCVHRISRSKRVELLIWALKLLPAAYRLDIYGDELDTPYLAELRALAASLGLAERVEFHGSAPPAKLPELYRRHRLILNMASETIDKTMLEAMTCGCYPVVTPRNAEAIGVPDAPTETPEAIAAFIQRHAVNSPLSGHTLYRVVEERHSLSSVVETLDSYIRSAR